MMRRQIAVVVLGIVAFAGCSTTAPKRVTRSAMRGQDPVDVETLQTVREAVQGWQHGGEADWSHDDRQELDAALHELDQAIRDAHHNGGAIVPASTGGQGAARVTLDDTAGLDPRTLYRREGHRYELLVMATRAWLAAEGEEWSAERRHRVEAGLRAARWAVFRLPALEKQFLRQAS